MGLIDIEHICNENTRKRIVAGPRSGHHALGESAAVASRLDWDLAEGKNT